MTDAPAPAARPNFDIGQVMSRTFKVYGANFPVFFSIVFVPYLVMQLIFTFGFGVNGFEVDPLATQDNLTGYYIMLGVSVLVMVLGFLVIQAVVVRAAVCHQLGQGLKLSAAFRAAFAGLIPLIILGLIAFVAVSVGMVFLIVPGIYLLAMFYVMVPAVVFEGKGLSGLGRSSELTSGYRWAIVGLNLILLLISFGAGILLALVAGGVMAGFAFSGGEFPTLVNSPAYLIFMVLLDAVVNGVLYPLSMVAVAITYLRLREIKDGGDKTAILEIFE
jgi:hypothetical protein